MSKDKAVPPGDVVTGRLSVFRSRSTPRLRVVFVNSGESLTKQAFKDECDINVIMRRYERSGVLPVNMRGEPRYVDCTSIDYLESMRVVADARSAFESLPARVRARFEHDPARLMEFLADERNREEARELGLLRPEAVKAAPVRVEVVGAPVGVPSESSGVPAVGSTPALPK